MEKHANFAPFVDNTDEKGSSVFVSNKYIDCQCTRGGD